MARHCSTPRHGAAGGGPGMTTHPTSIDEIDFWDLDMFVSGDPHAAWRILREAAQKRDIDFVTDIAHRIPAAIALSLLGVPEKHWDRLAELEHATVTSEDPEFTHGNQQETIVAASMEIRTFFTELVQGHVADPG